MATNRVTRSKIESYTYENVFSYVNNRTYVKDPRNPNSTINTRQFVYSSDPFTKAISFSDFPYIILEFPTLEYSKVTCDGKQKNITWTQKLTVRASRTGAANTRSDEGREDMLDMGDDLNEMFNNETVKQLFRDLNMYEMNLKKVNNDTYAIKNYEVYEAEYELTFMTRMKVSA